MVSSAQEKYLHYTEVNGLPRNITTCLEQDKYGYLWIGTGNGIVRYDGKNFYSYPELSSVGISHLLCDSKDNLWVAGSEGIYRLNRLTNYFEQIFKGFITKVQEDRGSIYFIMISMLFKVEGDSSRVIFQAGNLSDFCFSPEGIWLGFSNNGVQLLSRESGFREITASHLAEKHVSVVSKIGNYLLAGCYNGQIFEIRENGLTQEIAIKNHYFISKIVKIGEEIWLATDGNGIIILDRELRFLKMLQRDENTNASINSNSIRDVFPGNYNEIWIASYGAGLTCILPDNLLFQNILPEKGNPNSLVANEGVSVFVRKPYIYFGTNYGLSAWDENSQEFKNLSSDQLRKELNGTKVTALLADMQNTIWVGTYDGLLGRYTPDYSLIRTYHPSSISADEMQRIVLLMEISDDRMLIVTHFQNNILLSFDKVNGASQLFELDYKGSRNTYCLLNSLRKTRRGEILALISNQGLYHVNLRNNVLENRLKAMNSRIGSYISDFYPDDEGNYWFASADNGLLCLSEDGKEYRKWTVKDGLPSNTLIRIESTDDRYLWISSIAGICRFDTKTFQVLNFNLNDGLPANEFLERVSAKTHEGKIVFGSGAGFTIVDPGKVTPDNSLTDIIISDVTFQNQSIRSHNGKQLLKQFLEEAKEIRLPFNRNSFSIHFFAKDKVFLRYHNYAYRLEGFETDWTYLSESNNATYTNLRPGTYVFEVKTADKTKEGIPTRLTIHIQSPWYLRWFAYVGYAVIVFTILYLIIYAYKKRLELKKEKEIAEFKILKEHELTEKKLEFFTNISHDLRTPLTLIDAPISDLLQSDNLEQEQVKKLELVKRNSKRLFSLISDLLDFRKLTRGMHTLNVSETELSDIFEGIKSSFEEEFVKKSLRFETSANKALKAFLDVAKVEKILWNLVSNALKFSNPGGSISLSAEEIYTDGNRYIDLIVKDDGIGMEEDETGKIFERFYKAGNSAKRNNMGTGIGLSIVKEMVELHHGNIQVISAPQKGTTFRIRFPADKISYSENELTGDNNIFLADNVSTDSDNKEISSPTDTHQKQYNLPRILIVEDNTELRDYLASHLSKRLRVYEAEDGAAGLIKAKEISPDMIITDVQMPNMNGYEFCKEIRQSFDTSHIPVIMLTANSTIEHQITGLSTGADAYLTKPFDIKLLDAQVNSLLESRKNLRSRFMGIHSSDNLAKSLPQKDVDFIIGLKQFIEENIMDQNLSIDLLSRHFAVSHAQLHRKIKSFTGSTPNSVIKSIRLNRAYKLIKEEGIRVSEAAYQTGFSDPNYFTTCFKKEFGENPSQIG